MAQQQQQSYMSCIGSRCLVSTAEGLPFLPPDRAWSSVLKAAEDAISNLKDAIKALQEDANSPELSKPAAAPRKLTLKKILGRLIRASTQMMAVRSQIGDLKEKTSNLQKNLKGQGNNSQSDVLQKMDSLATNIQEALKRLQEEDEGKLQIIHELKEAKIGSQNEQLIPQHDHEQHMIDICKLAASEERLRAENERLIRDREQTLMNQETEQSAVEQIAQYKEVIAKVTADNMVFLIKLKQCEQSLQILEEQKCSLKRELDLGRSQFLKEISSEIEDSVKGSMARAEACEAELRRVRKELERQAKECQERVQEHNEKISQVAGLKDRVDKLEEERLHLLTSVKDETRKTQEAEAEIRLLHDHLKQSKNQFLDIEVKKQQIDQELKSKEVLLREKQDEIGRLSSSMVDITTRLESQKIMNGMIMKKKEEMEWLCLEAQTERDILQQQIKKAIQK